MKVLLIDFSPVLYGNVFSGTSLAESSMNLKKNKDSGKYNFDKYKFIVFSKIFEEIASLKHKFSADEVVICADSKEGYWRKDIWEGYKHKRAEQRDKTPIEWNKVFEFSMEIQKIFEECTSYKMLNIPKVEGDDIIFVLTEYLSKRGDEVIIYSSDHDFLQCLQFDNVQFWRTTRTVGMENSSFETIDRIELKDLVLEHIIKGDPGDGFGNIKHYSRFSDDFLEVYPHMRGKELQAYPKRFQIEVLFREKYGKEAYSHPAFGYKAMKQKGQTLKDVLIENPIYKKNFELNCRLALPQNIPEDIREQIITDYNNSKAIRDNQCLSKKFRKYDLKLMGKLPLF